MFNERLAFISEVSFCVGGYLTSNESKIVRINQQDLILRKERYCGFEKGTEAVLSDEKQAFIAAMQALNIDAWRNKWMRDQSDYVVTYITHTWGGAYQYARKAVGQGKM